MDQVNVKGINSLESAVFLNKMPNKKQYVLSGELDWASLSCSFGTKNQQQNHGI